MTAQQVADSGRLGTVIGNGHMLTSGMTHLSTGISWLLPFDLLAKTPSGMLVFYILMGLTLLCVRISIHQPLPRMRKNHDPIRDFIACVAVLLIYKLQHTVSNWYYIFPPVRISLNLNSKQQIVWLRFPHYLSSSSTSRLNLAKIWWNGTDLFCSSMMAHSVPDEIRWLWQNSWMHLRSVWIKKEACGKLDPTDVRSKIVAKRN